MESTRLFRLLPAFLRGLILDAAYGVRYTFAVVKNAFVALIILQLGVLTFGCMVARYADAHIGARIVMFSVVLSAILYGIVWIALRLLAEVADLSDDAVIELVRVASKPFSGDPVEIKEIIADRRVTELFELLAGGIAAVLLIDFWILIVGAWSDLGMMSLFVSMAIWFIFAVVGWGGPRKWLPRLQRYGMVIVGVLMFSITILYFTPGSLGYWFATFNTERAVSEQNKRGYEDASNSLLKKRTELSVRKAEILKNYTAPDYAEKLREVNAEIGNNEEAIKRAEQEFGQKPSETSVSEATPNDSSGKDTVSSGFSLGFDAGESYRFIQNKWVWANTNVPLFLAGLLVIAMWGRIVFTWNGMKAKTLVLAVLFTPIILTVGEWMNGRYLSM